MVCQTVEERSNIYWLKNKLYLLNKKGLRFLENLLAAALRTTFPIFRLVWILVKKFFRFPRLTPRNRNAGFSEYPIRRFISLYFERLINFWTRSFVDIETVRFKVFVKMNSAIKNKFIFIVWFIFCLGNFSCQDAF